MTTEIHTAERRALISAWILAALQERGPLRAETLAAEFDLHSSCVGWHLSQLLKAGQVEAERRWDQRRRANKNWWRYVGGPLRSVPHVGRTEKKGGIDDEHLEWMAYWQRRRAARRGIWV